MNPEKWYNIGKYNLNILAGGSDSQGQLIVNSANEVDLRFSNQWSFDVSLVLSKVVW